MSNAASETKLLLGIDAGGTKTRAALAEIVGGKLVVRETGTAGPGNVRSEGLDAATGNMMLAAQRALLASEIQNASIDAACLCVAGAGRTDEKVAVQAWALEAKLASQVRVVSDADVLFAGAEADGCTGAVVCLIAGTGSLAIGRDATGKTARCGGWGYLIGDQGSGYALGRSALEAIANAADKLGPGTALTERVLSHLELEEPQELVAWCYGETHQGGQSRRQIASLAPVVFQCAQDPIAKQLIAHAAADLAQQVAVVCKQLELSDPAIACTGSLLVHQPQFRKAVFEQLEILGIRDAKCSVIANPEVAALQIAQKLLLAM